jgi:hypothetical protein
MVVFEVVDVGLKLAVQALRMTGLARLMIRRSA